VEIITIAARFCGPAESGNGGYSAGMLANHSSKPVRVRLRRPPLLEAAMVVRHLPEGRLELRHNDAVVAEAEPFDLSLEVPEPPSYVDALAASRNYGGFRQHAFPTCFVCGPQRSRGDGLRIFAGPLPGGERVAAPWIPDESLCGPDGKVRSEFIWASLDCPGYSAAVSDQRMMVLGQIAARIDRRVHAAESCVIVGWRISQDGRKHVVGTALYDDGGEPCARAIATWIEPSTPTVFQESA
jgi:hypothetical protein